MKNCDVVIKYRTNKIKCNNKCDNVISTEYFLYIVFLNLHIFFLSMSCHNTKNHTVNKGLPSLLIYIFVCKLYFAIYAIQNQIKFIYLSNRNVTIIFQTFSRDRSSRHVLECETGTSVTNSFSYSTL